MAVLTLCNMIATNTMTSTSVFDVETAAPRATPSAEMTVTLAACISNYKQLLKLLNYNRHILIFIFIPV